MNRLRESASAPRKLLRDMLPAREQIDGTRLPGRNASHPNSHEFDCLRSLAFTGRMSSSEFKIEKTAARGRVLAQGNGAPIRVRFHDKLLGHFQ